MRATPNHPARKHLTRSSRLLAATCLTGVVLVASACGDDDDQPIDNSPIDSSAVTSMRLDEGSVSPDTTLDGMGGGSAPATYGGTGDSGAPIATGAAGSAGAPTDTD